MNDDHQFKIDDGARALPSVDADHYIAELPDGIFWKVHRQSGIGTRITPRAGRGMSLRNDTRCFADAVAPAGINLQTGMLLYLQSASPQTAELAHTLLTANYPSACHADKAAAVAAYLQPRAKP
jgi:hypothetical protein